MLITFSFHLKFVRVFIGCFLVLALGFVGCGKKSSNSTTTTSDEDPEEVNALAAAYPSNLAISVFDSESDAALRLADEVSDPNEGKPIAERVEENKDILRGTAESCLDLDILRDMKDLSAVTCYEFDSDMNPVTQSTNGQTQNYGTTDGTDGNDEACLVAFARNETQTAIRLVDKAMAVIKGMICQAKKEDADVEMPETGGELDLAEAMSEATEGELEITEAVIEAAEGTGLVADDVPVYTSRVIMQDFNGNELSITLRNQTEDGVDSGVLSFARPGRAMVKNVNTDPNNSVNMNENLSVTYEIDREESTAKLLLLRAAMLNSIESFNDDGIVNVEAIPESGQNSTSNRFMYLAFDMNTETGEGDLAYWRNPGGSYTEAARGFVFNIAQNDEGTLEGCGISGSAGLGANSGLSIRKAIATGVTIEPQGWWHPFYAQNTNANKDTTNYPSSTGTKVTKQCFERNDDGIYEVTTAATRGYEMVAFANSGVAMPKATDVAPPPPPPSADARRK